LRSHKIYWDLTISSEISQDLLIWQNTFDFWTFTFYFLHIYMTYMTLTCHDMPFDIWHLLRSHKNYLDLIRSTDLALYIWNLTFGIWHLTCHDIWHLTLIWHDIWHLTFDIWHLTFDICHLTFDIWHLTFDIWHLTFDMTEGTDSTSTDTYDIGTIR